MGKGALLGALFVLSMTMVMLMNAQNQSRETDDREYEQQTNQLARALAMEGRKAVLAAWARSNGALTAQPFSSINRDGGRIQMLDYTLTGSTLDFTVQADYDSTVHEVRSRFEWQDFVINPFQMKTWRVDPTIHPNATLNFSTVGIDDQNMEELEDILVVDLSLISDLSEIGVDFDTLRYTLETELAASGHSGISIFEIDQTYRDVHQSQDGIFYPDQVNQAVEEFALAHPAQHISLSSASGFGSTFGFGDGYQMVTVEGDMVLSNDLQGKGILVVEGDLIIPPGVGFDWRGIVLVKPPANSMNPDIELNGNVNIEGMFVSLQEVLLNVGHMDLSVYRDMSGVWAMPQGADVQDQEVLKHTHDYTAREGNYVVFHSDLGGYPNHQGYSKFNETLGLLNPGDEIFLEIFNPAAHGLGVMHVELTTGPALFQSVPAGFDSTIALAGNLYRTQPFPAGELEHFDIAITRLSSLRKMWDPPSGSYPGCSTFDGPRCVWRDYNRYGSLTLQMYSTNAGVEKLLYGASLYWHKRRDEEEDFTEEMEDLMDMMKDPANELDLVVGGNTTFTPNLGAILNLLESSGVSFGAKHLGTWHRQWAPDDPNNPL